MDIRGNGSPKAHGIHAGLLLANAPTNSRRTYHLMARLDDRWPLGTCFDVEPASDGILFQHAAETGHVQVKCAGCELLPAHGMAAAGN